MSDVAQAKANPVDEAKQVVDAAHANGITLRVLGAVAFRIHCERRIGIHTAKGREISDIDFVGYKKQGPAICKMMSELGYVLDRKMLIHEDRYFFQNPSGLRVDVFLDRLEMCHTIDFSHRLDRDYPTIPLDELLLEKLQIVDIERKDIIDVTMLLSDHDIGSGDREKVDIAHISRLLARDWGFYYTVITNLSRIREAVLRITDLQQEDQRRIVRNIDLIRHEIEAAPKSLTWNVRARVGPRKKWYRDVSVSRGAF